MRILRVAQTCYPDVKGGGAYHVHAMSRDQAALGHDVTVLTVSADDSLPRWERRDGYTVVRQPSTVATLGNDISLGVGRFLRHANRFDVVHAHSHQYFSTNLAALRRSCGGPPLAITNHGLYSQNAPEWLFDLYLRTGGRWTFNAADLTLCYTEEDRDRMREIGVTSRIEVVPNGVDTERFTPDGPTSDLIDHDGHVVLFVGRLVEGKRPGDAVEAVARLPDELNAKCYVAGEGPRREELAAAGGDAVEFLGHVPYEEMPALYRASDVLILSSRAEGLPRTVIEAFASGVPVVSSHLDHTAPVVRQAGETVKVGDIGGYAAALGRVLEDRDRLGHRGRETTVEQFRWDETVSRTTANLEMLLSETSTTSP